MDEEMIEEIERLIWNAAKIQIPSIEINITIGQKMAELNLITLILRCLTSHSYTVTLILTQFLTSNPFR